MFAQLLPDAGRAETTRQEPTRGIRQAERPKETTPPENRQAKQSQAETQPSAQEPAGEPVERENDNSAEPVAQETAADDSNVSATPPVDATVLPAQAEASAETISAETPVEDGEKSPVSGAPAGESRAKPEGEAVVALGKSSTEPQAPTTPAPQSTAPAEQRASDNPETGKPSEHMQAKGAREPELPSDAKQDADIPAELTAETLADDETGIRSGKPTGDIPASPKPAAEDREPGNPTVDDPQITEPAPDERELGKPGVATGPGAGKNEAVEFTDKPGEQAKDVPQVPRENLVRLDQVKPPAGGPKTLDDSTGEAGEPSDGEATAKTQKPEAARAEAEARPAKNSPSHGEFRPLIIEPAGSELRISDIRLGHAIDLSTTTVPSVHSANTAATTAAIQAQTQAPPSPPVPLDGIAVVIANNAQGGRNRFEIRLDPPELGRIDVRLHIDSKGQVTSHLIVDRPETLDLLRRDAHDLERSLQQSGLKTSDNGLQFSLRDQSANTDRDDHGRDATHVVASDSEPTTAAIVMRGYTRAGEGGGLDIRV